MQHIWACVNGLESFSKLTFACNLLVFFSSSPAVNQVKEKVFTSNMFEELDLHPHLVRTNLYRLTNLSTKMLLLSYAFLSSPKLFYRWQRSIRCWMWPAWQGTVASSYLLLSTSLHFLMFICVFSVQKKTIPVLMSGKDAVVRSQTGSGGIPAMFHVNKM